VSHEERGGYRVKVAPSRLRCVWLLISAPNLLEIMVADFKLGDVVMLRSGGPYMTVSFILTATLTDGFVGDLDCQWFDGPTLYKGTFRPSAVKEVVEPVAAPNDPGDY
jgi:uncharacterized protein YodC (DUF2158 family)